MSIQIDKKDQKQDRVYFNKQNKSLIQDNKINIPEEVSKTTPMWSYNFLRLYFLHTEYEKKQRIQRNISKIKKEKKLHTYYAYIQTGITILVLIIAIMLIEHTFEIKEKEDSKIKTFFITENLRGDKIGLNTYLESDSLTIPIHITDSAEVKNEVIQVVKSAITSEETVELKGKTTHRTLPEQTSTYYLGWAGALKSINNQTKHNIPKSFVFSNTGNEKIIIELTSKSHPDGHDGVTKVILSEDNLSITKAYITIYEINKKSNSNIETIARHEFGHALGLKHSSDPNDLMSSTIGSPYPFISTCNIEGIISLYNGINNEEHICKD